MKREIQAQKIIDMLDYVDSRVRVFESTFFGDETRIVFEGKTASEELVFLGCFQVVIDHVIDYDKGIEARKMNVSQIPYFIQDISIKERKIEGHNFLACRIEMFPLTVQVLCKEVMVNGIVDSSLEVRG